MLAPDLSNVQTSEKSLITGEELLAMGDIGPCELIDGRIVKMTPTGGQHGFVEANIGRELHFFVRQKGLGWVMTGEVGIYISRQPDRIRAADVAFISKDRLPKPPGPGFLDVAPELVVEIISPNDTWADMNHKLEDYFSRGINWVWVIEPKHKAVYVYHSATARVKIAETALLAGEGVLAGFEVAVQDLFG